MTQLEYASKRRISPGMREVAAYEHIAPEVLLKDIAKGVTVITKSERHQCRPVGIGKDLLVKVNANIGTSGLCAHLQKECEKLSAAIKAGADTVMDLSTGGDIDHVRRTIISASTVPVGTVPVYQVLTKQPDVAGITEDDFLHSIFTHIEDGVDFVTVHCGIKREYIPLLSTRIMGVVSRGGSFLIKWMLHHGKENPLYTRFDEICRMAKKYDVVLSLGDGLRPGCLADATDRAQIAELKTLGNLCLRARKAFVQAMVEGPGHVPIHQIEKNIRLQKRYCHGAPFYVLGPLVTDIAPGYDHIVGAVGGALAAYYGADFLCYLTPTEHLGLPEKAHVVEGVIASKIAAHAADIGRGRAGVRDIDDRMSRARSNLDWEGMFACAMNPEKARMVRAETGIKDNGVCSMCGELCSAKINRENRERYKKNVVKRT
ncbi:MAG: phosphomethylpyrimidine synthase ThiC [Spirochaetales bacterium]|nr:phosphomethylpyrimidine synthase ThiC [Spirochaetales bacterium]